MSNQTTYNTEYLTELFKENYKYLNKQGNGIFNNPRENALKRFNELGLPSKKDENYKYTDLSSIFKTNYKYLFDPEKITFNVDDVFKCDVPELNSEAIIVLNGFYYNRNELITEYDNGVIIGSLSQAAVKYPEIVSKYYGKVADDNSDSLVALNSAFTLDGVFLYVPKNVVIDKPVQIINISLSENDLLIQHRNLIVLEENSEAQVIVCDHSLSPNRFLTNQVIEIFAGENSRFDFMRLQNEHLATTQISNSFIQQEQNSNVLYNNITLHGGIVRNNLNVKLNGEGCENNSLGLYLSDKGQHIDNYTVIDHAKPNCVSRQMYKGILDDYSTGAFNGKILVRKDAQNTVAYQSNNNILLSDDARMNSKPQLEIYADDVKCSHGATVGQIDEEAMFYLRSRGIGVDEARLMLMYGFANDVIKQIKANPLKDRINDLVNKRLRGELSRCNNCQVHCGDC